MLRIAALSLALATAAATPALASDIVGRWVTPSQGQVEIFKCGAALCGKLITSPRLDREPHLTDQLNKDASKRGRKIKGLTMLEGFGGGPTVFSGGKVYNPEDGGTYAGTITVVDAGTLKLKGCVAAPLCKTQVWKRMK
jgi:uncharacterized protein (DUF2147 family)